MTQSANISLDIGISQANAGDLNTVRNAIALKKVIALADGAGLGQASAAWSDKRSIAGAGSDSLDLSGVLTDAFGQTITLTKVKAIVIAAAAANADSLTIGGGTNAFATFLGSATDEIILRPGGLLVIAAPDAAGYAVTPATGDLLKITNESSSVAASYEIVLIGA